MYDGKYLTRKVPKLDNSGEWQNIAYGVGIQEIIDRLAEYEDAEKRGQLTEVRHGRWHDVYLSSASSFVGTCSVCGKSNDIPPVPLAKYCPNCGAKMDGGQDDD